jgi:flagellar hook protein FlgE
VRFVTQNGVSAALLSGIAVQESGAVIANFTNGLSRQLYTVPLAAFPNPDGLSALDGNVFSQSESSGSFNLISPGSGTVGSIKAGSLEQSNVELSDELTRLVVAQRSYEASSQVISATNDLLKQLIRLFG